MGKRKRAQPRSTRELPPGHSLTPGRDGLSHSTAVAGGVALSVLAIIIKINEGTEAELAARLTPYIESSDATSIARLRLCVPYVATRQVARRTSLPNALFERIAGRVVVEFASRDTAATQHLALKLPQTNSLAVNVHQFLQQRVRRREHKGTTLNNRAVEKAARQVHDDLYRGDLDSMPRRQLKALVETNGKLPGDGRLALLTLLSPEANQALFAQARRAEIRLKNHLVAAGGGPDGRLKGDARQREALQHREQQHELGGTTKAGGSESL